MMALVGLVNQDRVQSSVGERVLIGSPAKCAVSVGTKRLRFVNMKWVHASYHVY